MITVTDLLDLFCKAKKLDTDPLIIQNDEGYSINLYYDWHDDGERYCQSVFITNEGESTWEKGTYEFWTMDKILNEKLEEQTQKEIDAQKRKELIATLTPEQRELLGVKTYE